MLFKHAYLTIIFINPANFKKKNWEYKQSIVRFDAQQEYIIFSHTALWVNIKIQCFCVLVLTNSAMKVIESYKDPDPNYTMRRQMEHEHGEAKQMDCLRRVGYRNF